MKRLIALFVVLVLVIPVLAEYKTYKGYTVIEHQLGRPVLKVQEGSENIEISAENEYARFRTMCISRELAIALLRILQEIFPDEARVVYRDSCNHQWFNPCWVGGEILCGDSEGIKLDGYSIVATSGTFKGEINIDKWRETK